MRKIHFALLLMGAVVFYACQKELTEIQLQVNQCKIIQGHYFGGGGMHDSADFIYNSSGKLIKWDGTDGYYDYYYTGNNISTRTFHDKQTGELWYVDSIRYNADNTIHEIVFYDYSLSYNFDTTHQKIIFLYQNNRVSDLQTVDFFDLGFGPLTDTTLTTLTWDGAGNISKMRFFNAGNWSYGVDDSVLYRYDVNPNYFQLIHPHFFLFDPEFQLQTGFETHLAYFYSKNNVTNFNVYGTWDYPIVYGLDSTNRVTSVDMGGFPYMQYKYKCD